MISHLGKRLILCDFLKRKTPFSSTEGCISVAGSKGEGDWEEKLHLADNGRPKSESDVRCFVAADLPMTFSKGLLRAERMHASQLLRGVSTPDRGWNFK